MHSLSCEAADQLRMLVVEGNADSAMGLSTILQLEGYSVEIAEAGSQGIAAALEAMFNLIILELDLPDIDGLDMLRELRQRAVDTPAIVLTGRVDEMNRVAAFRRGANDYVAKPFSLLELLERVKIQARPSPRAAQDNRVMVGNTMIDLNTREAARDGEALAFRPKEFDLFSCLLKAEGAVVSKSELLKGVWGFKCEVTTRTIDFHIGELRKKVEVNPAQPRHLLTVRGVGYRLIL